MRNVLLCLFILATWPADTSRELTGGVHEYQVAPGETLTSIGARFGVDARTLARDNGVQASTVLHPGDVLIIDNRHIAPAPRANGIVVNVAQRMLFVFRDGAVLLAAPVAVGRPDWKTPLGIFEIVVKEVDPVWDVPVSIQEEMAKNGQPVLTKVLPGLANPLGNRWLGLSAAGLGIHGTNQPASVYRFATHGCIRVHPDDMFEVFDLVDVGAPVELTYEPVLVTRSRDVVFLEVHRDPYGRIAAIDKHVGERLREISLETLAGTESVRRAVVERAGRAVPIDPLDIIAAAGDQ